MTEQEMRDAKVPKINNEKELLKYIKSLLNQKYDYGTCVYAMSMSAVAAFNLVAHKLGVTGFQASCADLDFLKRVRHLNCSFIVLTADDLLYPQYSLHDELNKFIKDQEEWLKRQAEVLLVDNSFAHPDVRNHWKKLAKQL